MNQLIGGILIMTATVASAEPEHVGAVDVAAIKTIVESVATLADRSSFEQLEALYADEIRVDYTSLGGGEVELKSPQGLMLTWAATLPGFDRTRHNLSNINVSLNGAEAIATADVVAEHYVEDLYWLAAGDYRYRLIKTQQQWKISEATFNLRREEGSRDAVALAANTAQQNPPAYVLRQRTQQVVQSMLRSLEDKDMDRFASLWADDAVQDMPYAPAGHPKRVVGKAELLKLYAPWPANSGAADFTSQLVFYPMQDPQMIFAEYRGSVEVVPTGRHYRQQYGGLFHVVDGKIQLFREYFDPQPFAWAFKLDPGNSE